MKETAETDTRPGRSGRPLLPLALALAVAAALFAQAGVIVPGDVPLNWDMAGHWQAALSHARALASGDGDAVAALLRVWSVYPPLYHLALGAWLAAFGAGTLSIGLFQWLAPCAAIVGCWLGFTARGSRDGPVAFLVTAGVLLGMAHFAALSHAFMLDAPAAALALLSLGLLARWWSAPSPRRAAPLLAAVVATLLTKHNVGLPLLVPIAALGLRAAAARDRRRLLTLLAVGLAALAVWAGFLTWQDHGWRAFLDFAKNRANTVGMPPWARAGEYARLFAGRNFTGPVVPSVLGLLAVASIRRWRDPFWQACVAYLVPTLLAISHHAYLLDRLALTAGMLVTVLAGFGFVAALEVAPAAVRRRGLVLGWSVALIWGGESCRLVSRCTPNSPASTPRATSASSRCPDISRTSCGIVRTCASSAASTT